MKIEETKLKEQADFLKFIIYQSIPIQSAIIKKNQKNRFTHCITTFTHHMKQNGKNIQQRTIL